MQAQFTSIAGFVLAGGESRRMGRPKALLPFGDEFLIERQLRALACVAPRIAVVGWPVNLAIPAKLQQLQGVRWLTDEEPGAGSLGGIYSALRHSRFNLNLILACDMPFVETELLKFLVRRAVASGADVTVPTSPGGFPEGLCAIYKRSLTGEISASLDAREYKISGYFRRVKSEIIPWHELAAAGFSPRVFLNMNSPKDYETARRFLAAARKR